MRSRRHTRIQQQDTTEDLADVMMAATASSGIRIRRWLMSNNTLVALSGAAATSAGPSIAREQGHQARRRQLTQRWQLGPMPSEPAFQAMHEVKVALLVEIHDGEGGTPLPTVSTFVARREERLSACSLAMMATAGDASAAERHRLRRASRCKPLT